MAQFVNTDLAFSNEAVAKNFKLEILATDPVIDATSKEGRMWYNSTDKAYKGFKTNASGVITIEPLGGGANTLLGIPSDGTWTDGLLSFTENTKVADGVDDINEILRDLAPAQPVALTGAMALPTPKSGYIAAGSGVNQISYAPGQQIATIVTSNAMTLTLPDLSGTAFKNADTGTLEMYQDGTKLDEFNLQASFDETKRRGSQTYPSTNGLSSGGKIKINSVSWYNSFGKWQRGTAQLNVSTPSAGEHNVQAKHITPGGTASTSLTSYFYDDSTLQPTVSGIAVSEVSPLTKTVSGVTYYASGATFGVSLSASNCFSKTYVQNPLTISGDGVNAVDVTLGDASISGVSAIPVHDETITVTNKVVILNGSNTVGSTMKFGVVARNATKTAAIAYSSTFANIYDTYATGTSTDLVETFTDEVYRLPVLGYDTIPSSISGQWNSANALTNGNAQVGFKALQYPKTDYTVVAPSNSANYSAFTGNQTYVRAIRKSGTPKNSGTLQLKGIASADIGTKYKVEIKLPTQTGWLDMAVAFNSATFTGADGQGCLISKSDAGGYAVFNYSVGTKSTANSGYMIMVKVTLINNSVSITELKETAW